jgi:ABC-type nitrate/sulfonate/bicarbonate transport system substrate-binding protein
MTARSRSSFLAAAGAGVAAVAAPRISLAQTTKLRVAGVLSDGFGEPFFAKDAGAFARAGFDLDVTSLANAGAVAAAIGGGALELGIGDLISGINAIIKGVPNLLLAGSGMYISSEKSIVLAVDKKGPIQQVKDLSGKAIGVPTLVGLTTASLRAWLPANGVQLDSVKIVEIPQPAAFPAIQRGSLDCALLGEPFITPYKEEIRVIGQPLDVVSKEFPQSVWYGSKAYIEADRDRARRIMNAIFETARWCNTHRDETFQVLVRDAHFDGEKLKGMIRTTFATQPLTPAMVQPVLNIAAQTKIFDRQIDASTLIAKV